ncbi:hypothetical protein ACFLUS_01585 [Chloroflexota bacterium]
MKRIREDGLPKPRELPPTIRRLIVARAITQRNIPREYLANELINEIREAGDLPPTLETTKRYISKARNHNNPLDEPWTLSCCSEYSSYFPPHSIPFLIDCIDSFHQPESHIRWSKFFGIFVREISIRIAIWIIRVKPIIDHISARLIVPPGEANPLPSDYPVIIAIIYSMAERANEIIGKYHFNSADLDKALFAGDITTFAELAGIIVSSSSKQNIKDGAK